ncbi:MAG: hypothetical protein QOC67_1886 [Pseudonocardiales bacterium]|nr:hypothetical protein [Pseudonocardiales bacterium]
MRFRCAEHLVTELHTRHAAGAENLPPVQLGNNTHPQALCTPLAPRTPTRKPHPVPVQAVGPMSASPSARTDSSRIATLRILPVTVIGNSSARYT